MILHVSCATFQCEEVPCSLCSVLGFLTCDASQYAKRQEAAKFMRDPVLCLRSGGAWLRHGQLPVKGGPWYPLHLLCNGRVMRRVPVPRQWAHGGNVHRTRKGPQERRSMVPFLQDGSTLDPCVASLTYWTLASSLATFGPLTCAVRHPKRNGPLSSELIAL